MPSGFAPTGSADPFGLRREAAGLVPLLIGCPTSRSTCGPALAEAADVMPVPGTGAGRWPAVPTFVRDRLYGLLREEGLPHDVVTAVLAEQAARSLPRRRGGARAGGAAAAPGLE